MHCAQDSSQPKTNLTAILVVSLILGGYCVKLAIYIILSTTSLWSVDRDPKTFAVNFSTAGLLCTKGTL